MPNIKPFRDYDEHDVINLFSYAAGTNVSKGTFVKIVSGWMSEDEMGFHNMPGQSYTNTNSLRYKVKATVTASVSGDRPLGMTLYDVKETDENGELLIYNPRKAAEMQAVVSGQAVPIITRGMFLYSGIVGNPTAGANLYAAAAGTLSTVYTSTDPVVGQALGIKDSRGWCLIKIDL